MKHQLNTAFFKKIATPPLIAERSPYRISVASTEEEIRDALRLRYQIFHIEHGQHEAPDPEAIDVDEFDEKSVHLIVQEEKNSRVIGTYRIIGHPGNQFSDMYSSHEYVFENIPDSILPRLMEIGRTGVAMDFRNSAVLSLLWQGIAAMMLRTDSRYLMGCVSFFAPTFESAWASFDYLKEMGCISSRFLMKTTPEFAMPRPAEDRIAAYRASHPDMKHEIPSLLRGYLNLGCKIIGEPAFDRDFDTADLLILLDVYNMPGRVVQHMFPDGRPVRGDDLW